MIWSKMGNEAKVAAKSQQKAWMKNDGSLFWRETESAASNESESKIKICLFGNLT